MEGYMTRGNVYVPVCDQGDVSPICARWARRERRDLCTWCLDAARRVPAFREGAYHQRLEATAEMTVQEVSKRDNLTW